MRNVKRARQAMADSQAAWNSAMHKDKAKEDGEEIVTLYTLAPETLDKPGTVSVGGYWLYSDDNVPEQVLREVLVDKESSVAQMQAYRLKIPYITFSEEGMNKALSKGLVYRADEQLTTAGYEEITPPKDKATTLYNGMPAKTEENAIVAGIDATIATIENAIAQTEKDIDTMPRTKIQKLPARTAKNDALRTQDQEPKAPVSALDAILAAPIGAATILRNTPPQRTLPLPEERSEDAIVAALNPEFAMNAAMYKAFVQAFRQALAEEGLVIVRIEPGLVMTAGCDMEETREEVEPFDPLADSMASILEAAASCAREEPQAPTKPKSTLVLGPTVSKTPKAPARDIPASNGKTPVETIKAIQRAWRDKTATQAELAAKYGMDSKRIWYFCSSRCKQYV